MKLYSLLFAVLASSVLPSSSQAQTKYDNPNFSALFPEGQKVTSGREPMKTKEGSAAMVYEFASSTDDVIYLINYFDFDTPRSPQTLDAAIDNSLAEMFKPGFEDKRGATLIDTLAALYSLSKGTAKDSDDIYVCNMRVALSGDFKRMWQVAVCHKPGKITDEKVKQFLDSVKIKQ